MKDFDKYLVSEFFGYVNKKDKTKLRPGYLVEGSQNVLFTDGERIKNREGYIIDGVANDTLFPVVASYEWDSHRGVQHALRGYNTLLEVRVNGQWLTLKSGWASVDFQFAEFWLPTEQQDILLFVNGDSNIYSWSGGVAAFASATGTTITLQGSTTWAESGFLTSGTRKVMINGTEYTYTGGEATTALTGITPNPTTASHAVASVIIQSVQTTTNKPGTTFGNDLIAVLNNQAYIGSLTNRQVFVSKVNDYADYTAPSSPRIPGESALLTLDAATVGFQVQEDTMYITAGKDQWYEVTFTLSSALTSEALGVKRLKTTAGEAAKSQALIGKIKNSIVYVSNEPTLDTLGRVENIDTPQSVPLSDPIKIDFDNYDFTRGHIKYHKNNLYIALPTEGIVLIFNIQKGFWEAPQFLPVGRFAIINNELYGHSSRVPETYKLFTGYNDNGNPIKATALFSYLNFGTRVRKKQFTEYYSEGYITSNTIVSLILNYDYGGFTQIVEGTISGIETNIIFQTSEDYSLGTHSLGEVSLGGGSGNEQLLPPKFRKIHTLPPQDFYEMQVGYSSDGVDQQWELLATGPAVTGSRADSTEIKD